MRNLHAHRASAWLAIFVAACAATAAPPTYSIQVLPAPSGSFNATNAYDVGPQGEVIGRLSNFGEGLVQGFVWQNGAFTMLTGVAGAAGCEARCMDDRGVIYGGTLDARFPNPGELKMLATRWVNGVPEYLGDSLDSNTNLVFGCSPTTGRAVGWAKPFEPGALGRRGEFGYPEELNFSASADPVRAQIWADGQAKMLARGLGASDDRASDINDSGQACLTMSGVDRGGAALFDPRFGLAQLPDLGSDSSWTFAVAINEAGEIAGWSQGQDRREHPVLWRRGRCIDLGLLAGFVEGRASDINNAGVIVGGMAASTFDFGVQPTVGAVYIDGSWHNLNTLIPPGSGFTINDAVAINEAGQILVANTAFPNRFALLTPAP